MGFDITLVNLLIFIKRWFCVDKDKVISPIWFVIIYDLIVFVYDTGNNMRGKVVSDINILMNHVDKVEFFLFFGSMT